MFADHWKVTVGTPTIEQRRREKALEKKIARLRRKTKSTLADEARALGYTVEPECTKDEIIGMIMEHDRTQEFMDAFSKISERAGGEDSDAL